ncbi:(2Fe-2S)-binding protein [Clostridium ihumii]|uniref:(2Fe-2S)-binding protein n=1 Tax=Clostridium ihumii TaxID=1470356 RepID=UPI00058F7449|nr:(2Fe-2S)-binding protein [Clostridium ihumii]
MSKENILCLCNHITEEQIIEAVENGAGSIDEIKEKTLAATGICNGCRCIYKIKRIIEEHN